jgi:hypothetical protein
MSKLNAKNGEFNGNNFVETNRKWVLIENSKTFSTKMKWQEPYVLMIEEER